MTATIRYERRYPATVNSPDETAHAIAAVDHGDVPAAAADHRVAASAP